MGKLIDRVDYKIEVSESIIDFATEEEGDWKVWNRYLTIDGKKAYI